MTVGSSCTRIAAASFVAIVAATGLAAPALAGVVTPTVPGPLLGVGAPAVALFAGGYWLVRRLRNRD